MEVNHPLESGQNNNLNEDTKINKSSTIGSNSSNRNNYYIIGGIVLIIIASVLYYLLIYQKSISTAEKEKELLLKEKELLTKEKELNAPLKTEQNNDNSIKINLEGTYSGTIKDGTKWNVYISNYDGQNFTGHNIIYWKKSPDGYKTNFNGIYNASNREIIMYEDKNAKGSGKFSGKVSADGMNMNGDWHRYTDGELFIWNLLKLN
jgi:hypothetical protein